MVPGSSLSDCKGFRRIRACIIFCIASLFLSMAFPGASTRIDNAAVLLLRCCDAALESEGCGSLQQILDAVQQELSSRRAVTRSLNRMRRHLLTVTFKRFCSQNRKDADRHCKRRRSAAANVEDTVPMPMAVSSADSGQLADDSESECWGSNKLKYCNH